MQEYVCLVHIATEQGYCASEFNRVDSPQTSESLFHVIYPPQDIHTIRIKGSIHLIPKWQLSQMIWVELHENEASRAKLRCLQMLI